MGRIRVLQIAMWLRQFLMTFWNFKKSAFWNLNYIIEFKYHQKKNSKNFDNFINHKNSICNFFVDLSIFFFSSFSFNNCLFEIRFSRWSYVLNLRQYVPFSYSIPTSFFFSSPLPLHLFPPLFSAPFYFVFKFIFFISVSHSIFVFVLIIISVFHSTLSLPFN